MSETESWKKRDLLYYCFIQRHHEVHIIENFIENIVHFYKIPMGHLLDVGCGLGRMFSAWAGSKWKLVDAFEPDQDYYSFASDHANHTSDKVTVYNSGFLDNTVHDKYNMVVSIHGPFQYLIRLEDKLEALRKIFHSLKAGGVVMLDMSNFLTGLANFRAQTEQQMLVSGVPVKRISNIQIDYHRAVWRLEDIFFSVDGGESDPNGLGTGYGDGTCVIENHAFSIFTLSELQLLLLSVGFINLRSVSKYCIQSLIQGGSADGPRLIITGQKPY
eukprot:gene13842-16321_t